MQPTSTYIRTKLVRVSTTVMQQPAHNVQLSMQRSGAQRSEAVLWATELLANNTPQVRTRSLNGLNTENNHNRTVAMWNAFTSTFVSDLISIATLSWPAAQAMMNAVSPF